MAEEFKPQELVEALARFNHYYHQDLNDTIRVTHAPGDTRVWTGNDFFEEGFMAAMYALTSCGSQAWAWYVDGLLIAVDTSDRPPSYWGMNGRGEVKRVFVVDAEGRKEGVCLKS
jgi:hypothetical protein